MTTAIEANVKFESSEKKGIRADINIKKGVACQATLIQLYLADNPQKTKNINAMIVNPISSMKLRVHS